MVTIPIFYFVKRFTIFMTFLNKQILTKYLMALFMAIYALTSFPADTWADTCTPHNYFIVSDVETMTGTDTAAVLTYDGSPYWVDIAGSSWIWESYLVADPVHETNVSFTRIFSIEGDVSVAEIAIAGDDYFAVYINDTEITREYDVNTIESNFTEVKRYPIDGSLFRSDNNVLRIDSTNAAYFYGDTFATPYNNPAGVIYVLSIESESCTQENTGGGSGSNGGGNDSQYVDIFSNGIGGSNLINSFLNNDFEDSKSNNNIASAYTKTDLLAHGDSVPTDTEYNPLLASALAGVPNIDLTCSIIALIIVILMYIVWLLIPSKRSTFDTLHSANKIDLHKLSYFTIGLIIILVILYILSLSCVMFPLAIMFILMTLGLYFKIL